MLRLEKRGQCRLPIRRQTRATKENQADVGIPEAAPHWQLAGTAKPARLLPYVLPQKLQRTGARELCGLCVVRAALLAIEAVARAGVEVVDLVLVRRRDFPGLLQRYRCIGLAPVEQDRALRLLVDERWYGAAVVSDRTGQAVYIARRFDRQRPAPAIADDARLAGRGHLLLRRLHILQRVLELHLLHDAAADLDILRRIADVEPALHAVEECRRDR